MENVTELPRRASKLASRIATEGFTLFWHRKSVVNLLSAAQGPICAICQSELRKSEATIDHVIPRADGGKDTLDNFLLAHEACNHARGCRPAGVEQTALHRQVLARLRLTPDSQP